MELEPQQDLHNTDLYVEYIIDKIEAREEEYYTEIYDPEWLASLATTNARRAKLKELAMRADGILAYAEILEGDNAVNLGSPVKRPLQDIGNGVHGSRRSATRSENKASDAQRPTKKPRITRVKAGVQRTLSTRTLRPRRD